MNTAQLLTLAQRYADHRGLTLSTVATYAAGDGKLFRRWSEGSTCTVRRAERVASWFSDHWPLGLDWPSDIPRPPKGAGDIAQDAA